MPETPTKSGADGSDESRHGTTATKTAPSDKPSPPSGLAQYIPSIKVTVASIALALLIGAVLIIVSDKRVVESFGYVFSYPWDAVTRSGVAVGESYAALVSGSVGSWDAITATLERAAPLISAGLAVTLAFRAGLFNIGAQGQLIIGAICAGYVGFSFDLPPVVHVLVALAAGLVGGAFWGGIIGFLKARTGAHEVITTIMLNYIAISILSWLLTKNAFQQKGSNNPRSEKVDADATFPDIVGVHSGIVLALLAALAVWWLLERSTIGFELRAVGANADASRTAGMSVANVYTIAMVLAGLLAGLAGAQQVLGHEDALTANFSGSIGFDAITVALLGRATPLGTVLAGLLFGALSVGGTAMQASAASTPLALTQVLQALIVLFVAAPALVKAVFRMSAAAGHDGTVLAKGWNS
ncbi:MAG: ABC transporter permease [Propionibacteriales bacterium]|nr:ABC transporter permease [Propionibacteriales bacterium]